MKTDNRSRVIFSIGGALLSVMLMACWLGALPATADDDQDWLRLHEEVQEGKIKPLSEILDQLAEDYVGQVIDVDLDDEDGIRVYEVELLGPQGQVVEFEINAVTGELLSIEGSNIQGMERR